jgi:Uma2 family endonuclease
MRPTHWSRSQSDGHVFGEAGYKLSDATWIQPDVSFLTAERVRATDPNGYFLGAPELAVEIISPSESARDIERKIALLLTKGSAAVWVIYPDSRAIHVHTPDRKSVALGDGDRITAPRPPARLGFPGSHPFRLIIPSHPAE